MSQVTVQMASKKSSIKKWWKKKSQGRKSTHAENVHLLPDKPPKENDILMRIKEDLKDLVKPKRKLDFIPEQRKSTEKNFKGLMAKMQLYDACLFIYNLEQKDALDGSEFYKEIAEKMWGAVIQELDGDHDQSVGLQSVSDCIKWAKLERANNDSDWIPQGWPKDIKMLFENYIIKHFPKFVHKKTDKGGLDSDLAELKEKISEMIIKLDLLPTELSAACLNCLRVYTCNQLTALADTQLSYEELVLLYKWALHQHRRLHISQYVSEDFDHMLFEKWFNDNGKKIESTGQEKINRALLEIHQSEVVWNSFPQPEVRYYFTDVPEKATIIYKAVEDLGDTLTSRLKSVFWEEFINFLTRYETYLKDKVDELVSDNGICLGLRIVKNCHILRETSKHMGTVSQAKEIQGCLEQCESKGTDLVFSALKPEIKEAFQKYFKKNSAEYENILKRFQCTLKDKDMQNNRIFNTLIYHRLLVLYIRSFFKCAKNLSHLNVGEIFSNGSKNLLEFVSNLVSDEDLLRSNPLDFITNILTAKNHESMRTTTVYFTIEHPDIREEHLKAILDIKGNVGRKEIKDLLYYIQNKKTDNEENKLCFFKDIQVGYSHSNMKDFLCCLNFVASLCCQEDQST
ncbi:uncharacterized protein LOC142109209 [Mixophyes fleayi]|uniref:uncharacterized protein LOC142109209 n=1 Tax=Mixophyes fleayi TaxID=3061075 RepID=UPI003F4DA4E7